MRLRSSSSLPAVALVGFLGTFLLLAGVSTWGFVQLLDAGESSDRVIEAEMPAALTALALRGAFLHQHQELKNIWLRGHAPSDLEQYVRQFSAAEQRVLALRQALAAMDHTLTADERHLRAIVEQGVVDYMRAYPMAMAAFRERGLLAADRIMRGRDRAAVQALDDLAHTLDQRARADAAAASAERSRALSRLMLTFALVSCAGLGVSVGFSWYLGRAAQTAGERRFAALARHVTDVLTLWDADGVVRYVSPRCVDAWGVTEDALLGHRLTDRVHPDDQGAAVRGFTQLLASGALAPLRLRLLDRHGRWRPFEVVAVNLLDDPSVSGIVGTWRDISEREQASAHLQAVEERHRATIDAMREVAFRLDGRGRWQYLSQAWTVLTGREVTETVGTPLADAFHPNDADEVAARLGDLAGC